MTLTRADMRDVDNLNVMAAIGKPKPVKKAKHKHQWRRGVNSVCLICGKKRPPKSERAILEKQLWDATAVYVKARDKCCVTCGATEGLTISHWQKAGKQIVRYDIRNCNCQCSVCNNAHNNYTYAYDNYMLKHWGAAVMLDITDLCKQYDSQNFKWSVVQLREMLVRREWLLENPQGQSLVAEREMTWKRKLNY